MSGIIHFVSGKKLELSEEEFRQIAPKLQSGGIRIYKQMSTGNLIPLNSSTMELIEHIEEDYKEEQEINSEEETLVDKDKVITKQKEMEEEFVAKSNCTHENKILYYSNSSKGKRYFPVCSFCGKRERYISPDKIKDGGYTGTPNEIWTVNDMVNAKVWTE